MSTGEKKTQETVVPDQLNITIRTSVPGYQQIEYKPSMTIKDNDEKGVRFYPLIKLNQSTINNVPQEYRIKQFFNKGLFQSLLIHNGGTPAKNLTQATRYGYVDNNINVTLNSIFPVGSVIYIGKKPYAIADHQWITGDWSIEVKQKKKEIDPDKVYDPQLYSQLVKDEIVSGEEQLKQLPETVIVGSNYSGPPVAQGIRSEPPVKPKEIQPVVTEPVVVTPPVAVTQPIVTQPIITQPVSEELSPEEQNLFDTIKQDFKFSNINIDFFRSYFKNYIYKDVVKNIFSQLPDGFKEVIRKFYSTVTNEQPGVTEGLSNKLYEQLCNQVTILKSPQDGDCFFKAVADGINIYNYENRDSKIYRVNYGKTMLYTANVIREIVARHVEELDDKTISDMLLTVQNLADDLNDKFNQAIENLKTSLNVQDLTPEQYLSELNNIYHSNTNFLIYNPGKIPIDINKYNKPFRVLEKSEIPEYIRSKNYWANDIAIEAICSKLNICIIPIEKYAHEKTVGKVRIKTSIVNRLKALLLNKTLTNEQCANKVMFLFYQNNHYELIVFNYIVKESIKVLSRGNIQQKIYNKKMYTIFKTEDLLPPFHILTLLYGTIYSTIDESYRKDFGIYGDEMRDIGSSVLRISSTHNWEVFKTKFDDMFPNNISIDTRIKSNNISQVVTQNGGAGPNYQYRSNYKKPYIYSKPINITKKTDEQELAKIAYIITIDMEVYPGTSLTPEQISQSKCNSKYNAIRKAFSDFTGRPYTILPIYTETKNTTKKHKEQMKGGKCKTRKKI